MAYIPHTDTDRAEMLAAIGVDSLDHLFDAVPDAYRFPTLHLPDPLSEMEVLWELQALAEANAAANAHPLFLGAGAYNHYSPSVINHMLLRGEFYTAYTPYQPELSQGTLQAVFEYQSMISALTGMEAANASHYDGATSLAEAVTVAVAVSRNKRHKVILSGAINPQYRAVTRTYHQGTGVKFIGDRSGRLSTEDLLDLLDDNTALFVLQYPNFFGEVENFREIAHKVHEAGALLCVVTDPIALALFKSPGELGADIVVGEGQSLGIPLSFGGPYLGFFATSAEYVRKIAGRIIGETVDQDGRKAYVMTLRPREQDIKRDKASSNICTNQGLLALAAAIYLSLMGKQGLRRIAELCYQKSHYAADQIGQLPGYTVLTKQTYFKEFVVRCPQPVGQINAALFDQHGIIGGYDLSKDYPDRENQMLIAVTETNTRGEIDRLVAALGTITR